MPYRGGLVLLAVVFASYGWTQPVPEVDAARLWQHLTSLSDDAMQGRKSGTPGASLARRYIQGVYQGIALQGFTEDYLQGFTLKGLVKDTQAYNVVGTVPGSARQCQKVIVVTAHYDHLGKQGRRIFNGADDNASGVAAMLEIARLVATAPLQHQVIFVATDAEEKGLHGARAFLEAPPVAIGRIHANLNLDMLAQGGRRGRLYLAGAKYHPLFQPLVDTVVARAPLTLVQGHEGRAKGYDRRTTIDYRGASDHAMFQQRGIPYLFLSVADHRDYHTEHDTAARLDPQFLWQATQTAMMILREMDRLHP